MFINKTAKMKVKRKSTPNKIIKLDKVKVMKIFRMFCIEMKYLIVTLHAKYGCNYKKNKIQKLTHIYAMLFCYNRIMKEYIFFIYNFLQF